VTTPTGIEWAFATSLRDMLAASSSFQTWIGAADAAEALTFIGFYQDDNPTARATGDHFGFVDVNEAALSGMRDATGVGVEAFRLTAQSAGWGLEWRVEEHTSENTIVFLNLVGAVLDEILSQAAARVIWEFSRWDTKTYPLKRLDGDSCRYQAAYTMTARQGE
jgi:hypothetical protein